MGDGCDTCLLTRIANAVRCDTWLLRRIASVRVHAPCGRRCDTCLLLRVANVARVGNVRASLVGVADTAARHTRRCILRVTRTRLFAVQATRGSRVHGAVATRAATVVLHHDGRRLVRPCLFSASLRNRKDTQEHEEGEAAADGNGNTNNEPQLILRVTLEIFVAERVQLSLRQADQSTLGRLAVQRSIVVLSSFDCLQEAADDAAVGARRARVFLVLQRVTHCSRSLGNVEGHTDLLDAGRRSTLTQWAHLTHGVDDDEEDRNTLRHQL